MYHYLLVRIGFEGHFHLRYLATWSVDASGCGSWQGIESALSRVAQFVCRVQVNDMSQLRGASEQTPGHPRYHTLGSRLLYLAVQHVHNCKCWLWLCCG